MDELIELDDNRTCAAQADTNAYPHATDHIARSREHYLIRGFDPAVSHGTCSGLIAGGGRFPQ